MGPIMDDMEPAENGIEELQSMHCSGALMHCNGAGHISSATKLRINPKAGHPSSRLHTNELSSTY